MHVIRISDISSLLASIPSMLPFPPHESVVAVAIVADRDVRAKVGPIMRIDLPPFLTSPISTAEVITTGLTEYPVTDLLIILTTEHNPEAVDLPYRATVNAATKHLRKIGFKSLKVLFLPSFTSGAPWSCYTDPDHSGVLPDPATMPLATFTAIEGRPTAASREELARRFTSAPATDRARLRPLVTAATGTVRDDTDADNVLALRTRLLAFDEAIKDAQYGQFPTDDSVVAELVASVTAPNLRDALLTVPTPEHGLAAENLLQHLWRLADDPHASMLAGLVAAHAYRRGDGISARIAAETATEHGHLARLILSALNATIDPRKFFNVIDQAAGQARRTLEGHSQA